MLAILDLISLQKYYAADNVQRNWHIQSFICPGISSKIVFRLLQSNGVLSFIFVCLKQFSFQCHYGASPRSGHCKCALTSWRTILPHDKIRPLSFIYTNITSCLFSDVTLVDHGQGIMQFSDAVVSKISHITQEMQVRYKIDFEECEICRWL